MHRGGSRGYNKGSKKSYSWKYETTRSQSGHHIHRGRITSWKFSFTGLLPRDGFDTALEKKIRGKLFLINEGDLKGKPSWLFILLYDFPKVSSVTLHIFTILVSLFLFKNSRKRMSWWVFLNSYCRSSNLRWLKTVSSTYIWMGRYNHSLSLDATIMVSKNCSSIGEHVVIIFMTQQVTIATVWPPKNTLNYSFRGL